MIDDLEVARRRLNEATALVQQYHGTDQYAAFRALFEALAESYKLDLITVAPEELKHTQAALKQALALRNALAPGANDVPKI